MTFLCQTVQFHYRTWEGFLSTFFSSHGLPSMGEHLSVQIISVISLRKFIQNLSFNWTSLLYPVKPNQTWNSSFSLAECFPNLFLIFSCWMNFTMNPYCWNAKIVAFSCIVDNSLKRALILKLVRLDIQTPLYIGQDVMLWFPSVFSL